MTGKIYVVSTPIGNPKDISLWAIEILRSVDIIASENRQFNEKRLINICPSIKGEFVSYYDGNEKVESQKLVEKVLLGKSLAIISSAGTPLICDPGYRLVKLALQKSIEVISIPGSSAILGALTCSGAIPFPFTFFGFFPKKKTEQMKTLNNIKNFSHHTIIFFESSHRIGATSDFLFNNLLDKEIILIKDVTKSTFQRLVLDKELLINLKDENSKYNLGEWVVIINGL